MPDLAAGDRLGRYRIAERLGKGGMGVVYRAIDPELDRAIAIKVLAPSSDPQRRRQQMQAEAQALARVRSPYVVAIHDVGVIGDRVFLAMEFVDGVDLRRWMATEPPWPRVLDVIVQAARGLAAIHAAQLVHRDVKPENVMVDGDGRVRVMDLGIAIGAEASAAVESDSSRGDWPSGTTRIAGTPKYMAPEQHLGMSVDASSDQFSFCVVAFEALYGVYPFAGVSALERVGAATLGRIVAPPVTSRVPRAIRDVLARGLSAQPEVRWPSMNALADELVAAGTRRGRRIAAWLGAATIAAFVTAMAMQRKTPCEAEDEPMRAVWNAPRADEIAASFASDPIAADTWTRAQARIDRYAGEWVAAARSSCRGRHVQGTWSDDMLARASVCLAMRRAALDELLGAFAQHGPEVAERALAAVDGLESPSPCADPEAIVDQDRFAPPAESAARIDEIRQKLLHADELTRLARRDDALPIAQEVVAEARAVGWPPLVAEAIVLHGKILADLDKIEEAAEALDEGFAAALAARNLVAADDAARAHAFLDAHLRTDLDGASRWVRLADACHRAAAGDREDPGLLDAWAVVHLERGEYEQAIDAGRRAIALLEALDPDNSGIVTMYDHLGTALYRTNDVEGALATYRHALELARRLYGPEHPTVATALTNMSTPLGRRGDYAEADDGLREAQAIIERNSGHDSIRMAMLLHNRGQVLERLHRSDEARAAYEESLRIFEKIVGPQHDYVALPLEALSAIAVDEGRYDDALAQIRRAVAVNVASRGPTHPDVAWSYLAYGEVLQLAGHHAQAIEEFERAEQILADVPGQQSLVDAWLGAGTSLVALGRAAEAVPPLEKALARPLDFSDAGALGATRMLLARASWDAGGDRARARLLAAQALADFTATSQPDQAKNAREWLATHPLAATHGTATMRPSTHR